MLRRMFVGLLTAALLLLASAADAAEVLQVRSGKLLQVGDHNRNYTVELACLELPSDAAAADWLRSTLPRRTKVNLRPLGNADGVLLARVQRLASGDAPATDLGEGLIAAGLAKPLADCR